MSPRPQPLMLALLAGGAVAGHVALFLLLSPDPWVLGYARSHELSGGRSLVAAILLATEWAALIAWTRVRRGEWRATLRAYLPAGRTGWLAAAAAVNVALATAVTGAVAAYPLHFALTALLVGSAWLVLSAAACEAETLNVDAVLERLLESRRTVPCMALAAALAALVMGRAIFDGIPHIPDEVVYLLQASYLSNGSLYVTGIPPGALDVIHTLTVDGRWFGVFPVGWPALLALGVALGVPELVNPMLTGVVILLAGGLIERIWNRRTSSLACFLLATSPWLLFLGASYMAHTASLAASLLAMRGTLELARGRRGPAWGLAGGLGLGVLVLVRPFEGVLVGVLLGGALLVACRSAIATRGSLAFTVTAILIGGLTLPYNRALTGSALKDPITTYFDSVEYPGSNRLGFGPDVGNIGWGNDALEGHSPLEAVVNANWNVSLVQIELFGWSFGSLGILLLVLALRPRGLDFRAAPAIALVALVGAGYALYWYAAADFGPRYWSQMLVPLAALTAAGLLAGGSPRLRRLAVLASLLGMPVVVIMRGTLKYHDYRGMSRDVERLAEERGFAHDLILVRGEVFSDYSSSMILNPPGYDGPGPLYFRWVEGDELSALRARFPGRREWVVDGPSITGGEPRIVSGPMP